MADLHSSIRHHSVISGPFGYPKIKVPHDAVMGPDDPLVFLIHTAKGDVYVTGHRRWHCKGGVDALAAAGLVRPDWMPGLPGNNKTRQTIAFEKSGPRLLIGNRRGANIESPYITVQRISNRSYEVIVTPTSDQIQLLEDARTRYWQRRGAEREREKAQEAAEKWAAEKVAIALKSKAAPESEVRQRCLRFANNLHELIFGHLEATSFRPDARMSRELGEIFEHLNRCLSQGVLRPEFIPTGNVVSIAMGMNR